MARVLVWDENALPVFLINQRRDTSIAVYAQSLRVSYPKLPRHFHRGYTE